MRIAYFCQRVPYPPDRGDKITTYHGVRYLSRNHQVEVFCLAAGPGESANALALAPMAHRLHAEAWSARGGKLRALTSFVNGRPMTLEYYHSRGLKAKFRERHAEQPFDAALVFSSSMAPYVETFGALPRVMQFCDLDSLKWAQYAKRSRWPTNWVYARESRLLLEYERRVARSFSHSVVSTRQELRDLEELIPGAAASYVANGVDLDFFQPMASVAKLPGNLVFTGVMDYWPNEDAVCWFAQDVLPRVREEVPLANFTICGARPSRAVAALAGLPGVEVTGRVKDVRPFLARAQVAVVPLRVARGIQNKLLEAMAMGLPCVTTSQTAMGLEPEALAAVRIGVGEDGFAREVVRLLRAEPEASELGQDARRRMEHIYRWDVQLARLEEILVRESAR